MGTGKAQTARFQIGTRIERKKSQKPQRGRPQPDHYWRWLDRNLAGNAIDFHVQVLGLSFHGAMRLIHPVR
jgi:hypothetical protein